MLKLLKYELRSKLVILAGSGIILALFNILFFIDSFGGNHGFRIFKYDTGANAVFSMMLGFAAMIVVLVGSITRMEKDLYTETGYLIFTLPERGYSILGAKLTASFIEIVAFSILNIIFFILQIIPNIDMNQNDIRVLSDLIKENFKLILFTLFMIILSLITFILMVYFSLVSVRSFFNKRKLGKAASFCVFIGLSILIGLIGSFLVKVFPQTVTLHFLNGSNIQILTRSIEINTIGEADLNIASFIFNLALPVILFISTSYLIEKRVDV